MEDELEDVGELKVALDADEDVALPCHNVINVNRFATIFALL